MSSYEHNGQSESIDSKIDRVLANLRSIPDDERDGYKASYGGSSDYGYNYTGGDYYDGAYDPVSYASTDYSGGKSLQPELSRG